MVADFYPDTRETNPTFLKAGVAAVCTVMKSPIYQSMKSPEQSGRDEQVAESHTEDDEWHDNAFGSRRARLELDDGLEEISDEPATGTFIF
jgi:hypothetical protein